MQFLGDGSSEDLKLDVEGKNRGTDSFQKFWGSRTWPLASGLASAGRAKRKQFPFHPVGDAGLQTMLFLSMDVDKQSTIDFASNITGAPLGRTAVLVGASEAPFRELSHELHGHGFWDASFHGFSTVS